jgi:hydroxymethylbilane synthase
METLRLGTRGSQLALYQANVAKALLEARAGVEAEIVVIKTSGDRLADAKLSDVGGKRLFAAALEREDPLDAVVVRGDAAPAFRFIEDLVAHLGESPRIGTSSVRRTAQLSRVIPGARFLPVRGNLDTRLAKLDAGEFDALILAAAGLKRLDRGGRISATMPADVCVPAPGQGIIALEARAGDTRAREAAARINDWRAAAEIAAERAVVRRLGGGCQMPIGAYASVNGTRMDLAAVVISLDGGEAVRASATGGPADAEALGTRVAEQLLADGAADILAEVRRAHAPVEGLQP